MDTTKETPESGVKNSKSRVPVVRFFKARPSLSAFYSFLSGLRAGDPDEERWEKLLSSPASQRALEKMAAEALEDKQAGRTQDFPIRKS